MGEEITGGGPCKRCGRNPAAGFAQIGDDWYCHEERERGRGTCYEEGDWEVGQDELGRLFAKLDTAIGLYLSGDKGPFA